MKDKCKPALRLGTCHGHLPQTLCSSNCALHFLCYFWITPTFWITCYRQQEIAGNEITYLIRLIIYYPSSCVRKTSLIQDNFTCRFIHPFNYRPQLPSFVSFLSSLHPSLLLLIVSSPGVFSSTSTRSGHELLFMPKEKELVEGSSVLCWECPVKG